MKKDTFWKLSFIFIIAILAGQNCQAQNKTASDMKNIAFHYSDGSGNIWKISSDSIRYLPIEPEMSSSGVYSGGEKKENILGNDGFLMVYKEFESLFKNNNIHLPQRIMTSGMLIISKKGEDDRILIIKQGDEMNKLENLLKKLINK